jgi:hypothetical protein
MDERQFGRFLRSRSVILNVNPRRARLTAMVAVLIA